MTDIVSEDSIESQQTSKCEEEKIKIEIRSIRKDFLTTNAKLIILKALQKPKDKSVPENSSVLSSLLDESSMNLLHKRVLNLCLYSNCMLNRILDVECSDDKLKRVLEHSQELHSIRLKATDLYEERKALLEEKLACSKKYQEVLYDYNNVIKEEKQKDQQTLQSLNPTLAKEKQKSLTFVKKINLMKKLILNMLAGDSLAGNKCKDVYREMLEKHTKLFRFDDLLEYEIES